MFWYVMNRAIMSHTMSMRLKTHGIWFVPSHSHTSVPYVLQNKTRSFVIVSDPTCQSQLHALAVICQTVMPVTWGSEEGEIPSCYASVRGKREGG